MNNKKKKAAPKKTIFDKVNTTKMIQKKRQSNLVKLIKNIQLKQNETKYLSVTNTFTNQTSNDIFYYHLWGHDNAQFNCMPGQGNTDGTRVGDSIVTTGYKIRFHMQFNLSTSYTVHFYYLPFDTAQGDPTVQNQLQHSLTGFLELDPIQTKRWPGIKYLGRRTVRPGDTTTSGGTTTDKVIYGNFWIPLKKKITFLNDGSDKPANLKEKGYFMYYITGYPSNGVDSGSFKVDTARFVTTLYYKDP